MTDHALTLNAGSSSIKFGLFDISAEPRPVAEGLVERIGGEPRLKARDAAGETVAERDLGGGAPGHRGALEAILGLLAERFPDRPVRVVGHRVVHGGPHFGAPVVIDGAAMAEMERLAPFAPLHQPHNLAGIRAAADAFPGVPQVACFDTAFHRGQPWVNDVYALPREYYDKGVRRYGFHGLSYQFIAGEMAREAPALRRVIVAHLGNGASMCALHDGRSIASTMGFSPLDGLVMGTRCGQIDPGVLLYLMEQEGMGAEEISELLWRRSGLLGLSGVTNDMRALEAAGTAEAEEAIEVFCARIRRETGSLAAALEGLDALVFTGGIGENSRSVRERVCRGLGWLGIALEGGRNRDNERVISAEGSRVPVMVIPTDEEIVIARAAAEALRLDA